MDKLAKKYQKLVESEASLRVLEESVSLLKEASAKIILFTNEKNFYSKEISEVNKQAIVEKIKLWVKNKYVDSKQDEKSRRIIDLIISLNEFPRYLAVREDKLSNENYSFLIDISFLIFHNAYFSLLPEFKNQPAVYKNLIKLFLEYSTNLNNPSDAYQVKAMCYEAEKKYNLAKDYYYKSLMATSSDDPAFIASLQDYWSFLMENGNDKEALDLLLNIKNEKLIRDIDYYDGLIRSTFMLAIKKKSA